MSERTPHVSRRGFLLGSAAAASGALLADRGFVDAQRFFGDDGLDVAGLRDAGYEVRHTICHQCGAGCGLTALVKPDPDGGAPHLMVLPNQDPEHPQRGYCGRGATAAYTWDGPQRLRTPLKNVGERGEGRFEAISWEAALDEIGDRLAALLERDGPDALAATTHDFKGDLQWLMTPLGAPNVVKQSSTCNTAGVVGRKWTMGSAYSKHSTVDPDYDNVRYVLFPGRSLNAPIGAVHRLAKAREYGAKAVFLNPAMPDVAFADGEWLACYPGTDAAFLLGVAKVLIDEGRHDDAFVRRYTDLPFLIREDGLPLTEADVRPDGADDRYAVRAADGRLAFADEDVDVDLAWEGTVRAADGADLPVRTAWARLLEHLGDYDAPRVARITGLEANDVLRVARGLAINRGVVEDTWYNTRNGNDTDAIMALMTVNALLGSIDTVGGLGFKPSAKVPDVMATHEGRLETIRGDGFTLPDMDASVDKRRYPEANATFDAVIDAILDEDPYPITGLIALGATMFHRDPNTARLERALKTLDLIVNIDIVHQEFDDWADYVLPAEMFLEREGLDQVGWSMQGVVALQHRVTAPPEGVEARPHLWIMLELLRRIDPGMARAMGYEDRFADVDVFRRDFLAPIQDARIEALAETWDLDPAQLREELDTRGFKTVVPQRYGRIPYQEPFDTPSGRLEVYALAPVLKGYRAHGFAEYFPPPAYTAPSADDELFLVNGKSPIGSSGVASVAFPTQYLVDNALWIHPDDAERLGFADGDDAEVEGLDTGWVATTEVRVTPRVRPGVGYVYSYTGGNRGSFERRDDRFAKRAKGLNPHGFATATIDPVTGSNANNASIRIRRA